jgi:hypothetical protein
MTLQRSRRHLITVRLSSDEHNQLKQICEQEGARSISEFVRETIIQRTSASRGTIGTPMGDLTTVASKLEDLEAALRDMSGRIAAALGHPDSAGREDAPETETYGGNASSRSCPH